MPNTAIKWMRLSSIVWMLVLLFGAFSVFAQPQSLKITSKKHLHSKTGYITLKWKKPKNDVVKLQQIENDQHKKTLYEGKNNSLFISGLHNGTYHYILRLKNGSWSERITLIVNHYSIIMAWSLFILGAIIFCMTTLVIFKGTYDAKKGKI